MNKKFTKKVLLILGIAGSLLLNSCDKNSNKDKIIDVEKEFNVQLWEKLDDDGGKLQFVVSTVKEQSCGGTHIDMNMNQFNSRFVVTIKSLIYPRTCSGISAKVSDTLTIGSYAEGTYKMNINLKDIVLNEGLLTIEKGKFSMSMDKQDGISVSSTELLRVPSGTIWGYVSYDNGQEAKNIKFFENLGKMATPLSISNGNYGHFVIDANKNVDIKTSFDTKKQNIKKIFYNLNKPNIELENLILEYRAQGLEIKMLTYNGKTY
jgi:hypothetical protein